MPLKSLRHDPANPKRHGKRNLEAIGESLRAFGQVEPLVVQKGTGMVIGGNGRLDVMLAEGQTHADIVEVQVTDEQARALGVALNRTAELGVFDEQALAQLLAGLPADLQLAAGFTEKELARALMGLGAGVIEDQPPSPDKNAVSKRGDLWILGKNRLLNGDSTSAEDVQRLMNGERARLFATDPPYLVGYDGTNHYFNPKKGQKREDVNKDWADRYGCGNWDDADVNPKLYDGFIGAAVAQAIQPDAAWYCWHASVRGAMLEAMWAKHGAFVHQQIIWAKNRPILSRAWYMWQHEPCFMGWIRPNKPKRMDGTSLPGVWEDAGDEKALTDLTKEELLTLIERTTTLWRCAGRLAEPASKAEHPTEKPVEIFARPMRQHTRKGEVCYEPFSGSGTQISAAEQLGRRCFAIEIEPVFVDVAIRRWQALTGLEATLEATGKTWAQTAAQRQKPTKAAQEKPRGRKKAPAAETA